MTLHQFDAVLLIGGVVMLAAIAAVRLSARTGMPFLVLYVGLGVLVGPEGPLGIKITISDPETARTLGYAALLIILAEGGLTTKWSVIRPVLGPAAMLGTVGVLVSAGITGAAAALLLGLDWPYALLLGAVLAPTDSAAVFAVLRRMPVPHRLAGLLEAESGGNDACAVLLVVALSTADHLDAATGLHLLGEIGYELVVGLVIGLALGKIAAAGLGRVALPAAGLYPIAVITFTLLAYAVAAQLHGSGFLAVYVCAVFLGNARLPHRPPVRAFAEGLAWLAQISLFVMLGMLVRPSELLEVLLPAIVVGLVLLLVARPVSVVLCLAPFRQVPSDEGGRGAPATEARPDRWREYIFLSWAGLRGAVPIVLAIIPVVEGVADSGRLFNIVFLLVVLFTVVQSPTLPDVTRHLGLAAPNEAQGVDVETVPLMRLNAELLELHIPPESRLHGLEIFELRLPKGAAVSLLIRDGETIVPTPYTPLRHEDDLLIVAPSDTIEETEHRLRVLARHGRLGGWYDEASA